MNKQKEKKETIYLTENIISEIKQEIKKYPSYDDFCINNYVLGKTNKKINVLKFPIDDLNRYFDKVIKPMLQREGITERFFFEQITRSGENFLPKSFFDYIYNHK